MALVMTLEQIMTTRVITIGMDDKVLTAQSLFDQYKFHHLLVVSETGLLVGIVSDRDLLKAISPFISTLIERPVDLRTLERPVHKIMGRNLITASRNDTIKQAAILMLNKRISCLPIVSSSQVVEGIVTWKDILKWLVEQMEEGV
jgi:acetoin utilization protein AcuB